MSYDLAPSKKMTSSLGCEVQPNTLNSLSELRNAGLGHLQITIPNKIHFEKAAEIAEKLPLVAHSNLLNAFGENNWSDLRQISKQIRKLKPLHVVEHFTALRPNSTQKSGVHFDLRFTTSRAKLDIADSIQRWQDELRVPLSLENVPVTEDVDAYLDFLFEIRVRTGCNLTCDIPHLLLSMISAKKNPQEIAKYAALFSPLQVHLGGLSKFDDTIRDNHDVLSPWMEKFARDHFPGVQYVTLEQSYRVPANHISAMLRRFKAAEESQMSQELWTLKGETAQHMNESLCADAALTYSIPSAVRSSQSDRSDTDCNSAMELFDRYVPFIMPLASFSSAIDTMTPFDAVCTLATITRWAISYLSWWSPQAPRFAEISYGENSTKIHSKIVQYEDDKNFRDDQFKVPSKAFKFYSKKGFWVQASLPEIAKTAVYAQRSTI